MTTNEEHGQLRVKEHADRVRLFQMLCALDPVQGTPLSQLEIESRLEELFVLPGSQPGESQSEIVLQEDDELASGLVTFDEFRQTCERAVQVQNTFADADALVEQHSTGWKVARMAVVDRTLIRLAIYEAFIAKSVPVNVALSEAVVIAKEFGGAESARFVNGILARIAKALQR